MRDLVGAAHWSGGRYARLVARMYPDAPLDRLGLVCDAVLWLFLYDDHLRPGDDPENDQSRARRLAAVTAQVVGGLLDERPEPPLGALWDLRGPLLEMGGAKWWRRCAEDLCAFADSLYEEARSRAAQALPGMDAYVALRRRTSGWGLLTDLVEFAADAPLPAFLLQSPEYEEMRWAAGDVACAVNDILSLRKELAEGECHNLVLILQNRSGSERAETNREIERWIAARLTDYHNARDGFLARCDRGPLQAEQRPVALAYIRGLEHLMRGSLDWSLESGRYQEPSATSGRPTVPL
ncbi:terpene synthase family protein [Streptomyces sp. NPDC002520]